MISRAAHIGLFAPPQGRELWSVSFGTLPAPPGEANLAKAS
jgi:hypothetical protein